MEAACRPVVSRSLLRGPVRRRVGHQGRRDAEAQGRRSAEAQGGKDQGSRVMGHRAMCGPRSARQPVPSHRAPLRGNGSRSRRSPTLRARRRDIRSPTAAPFPDRRAWPRCPRGRGSTKPITTSMPSRRMRGVDPRERLADARSRVDVNPQPRAQLIGRHSEVGKTVAHPRLRQDVLR